MSTPQPSTKSTPEPEIISPQASAATSTPGPPVKSGPAETGTPAAPPGPENGATSAREYGLYAVIAGLVALAALDGAAIAVFHSNMNSAVGVIGALSSPIVAMVSAYFGIKVGAQSSSANTAASEQARNRSQNQTMALLGQMTPEQAGPVLKKLGIPVPD